MRMRLLLDACFLSKKILTCNAAFPLQTAAAPGANLASRDELSLLVQAGLTPYEALQTATINPARYLGLDHSLGTVEPGKLADLVLLDGNPLENIRNTRRIAGVFQDGHYLAREVRAKTLADLETVATSH